MNRIGRWGMLLLILGVSPANLGTAAGIDSPSEMYSFGVQAYFSGNLSRAEMYLYRASELNPHDPRPHYFRGLSLLRQGRSWEAEEALQEGAAIEARADSSAYGIGKTLERVQGGDRLRLEEFRRAARLQAATSAADNARRRYEQLDRRQSQVQRTQFRLPLDALTNPVQPGQIDDVIVSTEVDTVTPSTAPQPPLPVEELAADDLGDPFVDDPTTDAAPETEADPVDVPAAARGSVKASSLPGIFGRMIGDRLPAIDVQGLRDRVPGLGGGAPPAVPPDDFGGEFPPPEGNFFDGEDPMPPAADEENPFDF